MDSLSFEATFPLLAQGGGQGEVSKACDRPPPEVPLVHSSSSLQNRQIRRQLHRSRDVIAIRLLSEVVARLSKRPSPATFADVLVFAAATLPGKVARVAKFRKYG